MGRFFSQAIDTAKVKSVLLEPTVGSLVHPAEFSQLQLLLAIKSDSSMTI